MLYYNMDQPFLLICHLVIKGKLSQTAADKLLEDMNYTPEKYLEQKAILNILFSKLQGGL
jgi:hypothetical protein